MSDVARKLARDLKPVKPLMPANVRSSLWLALVAVVTVVTVLARHAHLGAIARLADGITPATGTETSDHTIMLTSVVAALALLHVIATAARHAFRSVVPGSTGPRAVGVAGVGLGMWAVVQLFIALLDHDSPMPGDGDACLWSIVLLSLLPIALGAVLLRRGNATRPALTGALLALASAGVGALAAQLLCPSLAAMHVFWWHVLPVAALGGIGATIGLRLFKW